MKAFRGRFTLPALLASEWRMSVDLIENAATSATTILGFSRASSESGFVRQPCACPCKGCRLARLSLLVRRAWDALGVFKGPVLMQLSCDIYTEGERSGVQPYIGHQYFLPASLHPFNVTYSEYGIAK